MKENSAHLRRWLDDAEALARDIRERAQKERKMAIFTISSTVKGRGNLRPYLTPIRRIVHGFIGGSVVFSQTQAVLLSRRIDGIVDQILVDAEKKLGIYLGIDQGLLRSFGLDIPPAKHNARVNVELGNLSVACQPYIRKSHFQEYKPNDLTVESVWHFLSGKLGTLSGKRVAIIGCGNIGFKLALKLVECGAHVELVRRDLWRGTLMADVINVVKPESTIAIAHYNPNPLQASLFCDVIIGCTNGIPVITWEMIQSMKPAGIIIDVGKGSIFKEAIKKAIAADIAIIRCDVTSAVDGLISTIKRNKDIQEKEMGRAAVAKGVFVVSGGFLGLSGDIVVDNYRCPALIIGVADGSGDLKRKLTRRDLARIAAVKKGSFRGKN
jgi:hypothetical protein